LFGFVSGVEERSLATKPIPEIAGDSTVRFTFWRTYLLVASALFGLQGVSWILFGSFDPFGFYTGMMAWTFWGSVGLTSEAQKTFSFAVGPLGATTAGYFVLVHYLVRYGFPRRERWAYTAVVTAVLVWFGLDTAASLRHGAWFNVVIVNVPCLILLGIPLLALRRAFR
jgi:hypothetical protein